MNGENSTELIVFTEALEVSPEKREAFLAQACFGDAALRHKVEELLAYHGDLGNFLEDAPSGLAGPSQPAPAVGEKPGDRIGPYKLLQQIGEGGCGAVFMAEQCEPVRRLVALKIIKPGMDSKTVIARFEAERQALALMDHPNIAKVFDAGANATGRPYFAMELVRGAKITDYCDQQSLSTPQRLELFIQVCAAVQHAHQKGIIHRDIKPSNILVSTSEDGKATPKVIDFGIAKAITGLQLTDKTVFTAFEMFIGTPAYMSPEQADLSSVDADTRTDIYSLGVLLYELLTGTTPFDTQELLRSGLDELRRVIRTEDPVRPSTRLSAMTAPDLTTLSQRRGSEPPRLIREMRGDLDWIVMKAMEKDRTRRYPTANSLAVDVEHFLKKETVAARPPSAVYKLRKLVLRNKLAFAAAAAIFLLLTVALAAAARLAVQGRRAMKMLDAERLESDADDLFRDNKRAEAFAALRQAIAIRRRYFNSEPPGAHALEYIISGITREPGKLGEAEGLLDEIVTPALWDRPECADVIAMRAEIYARDGKWAAAAPDAIAAAKLRADSPYRYHMLAPLLAATTNLSAYQEACSNIVARFAGTTDINVAHQMAKDCLILPQANVDLNAVAALSNVAVTKGKGHGPEYLYDACEALAQYRLGHYGDAVKWAQQSATVPFPYSQAEAYAVLAMARFKLGDLSAARKALDQCNQVVRAGLPHPGQEIGQDWRDWIVVHALQSEAGTLIKPAGL